MPNVIDWLRATAEFMAKDRPDIYTVESAMADLDRHMNDMRTEQASGLTSFASYFLIRYLELDEDGNIEVDDWDLARKISSATSYAGEDGVWVVGYTKNSGVLKYEVQGIPDILDDDLEV